MVSVSQMELVPLIREDLNDVGPLRRVKFALVVFYVEISISQQSAHIHSHRNNC
jgi:hypothetical protein